MKFYLGTHHPGWLSRTDATLFVSDVRLSRYRTLPRAQGRWALDSGGFSMLSMYGSWAAGPTPKQYVARVRRYDEEIGGLDWAAPQDYMCEPFIVAKTGLSTLEHLHRTVGNLIDLRSLDSSRRIIPSIQGYRRADYERCIDLYDKAGIDLAAESVVAVGSVCRRQATTEAADIINAIAIAVPGIRLHGFGIKTSGLNRYGHLLASADSMAWSYGARRAEPLPGCVGHKNCANCFRYALRWRDQLLANLAAESAYSMQLPLFAIGRTT
ncbi:hypothetical protein [Nocardia sp. BMG51109]|uniref:deazapurine DNA modification protein DpdA family protein n=1 Tax=Nocardia sp. BMG51109 TaxID=1056816 RepID=UPI0004B1F06D|nr:hypothetical protein [Nocardia sp. BMG51109]